MADARRTLESAADFTRGGGAPASNHDASHPARRGRVEAEQGRLVRWAEENRKLGSRLPPEFAHGGEHQVYFNRARQHYIKATLPARQLGYGVALGSNWHGATSLLREAAWWLVQPNGSGLVANYNFGYSHSDTTGQLGVRLRLIDRLHRDSNPIGIGGWVFTDALAINKSGAIPATGSRYGQSGRYALIIPRGGGAGDL